MSLILEALRKSEAERQRGRAPGLFVAQAGVPAPARRAPGWAWALGALLVAVLVAWGLREWQRGAPVAVAPAAPAAVPIAAAVPLPSPPPPLPRHAPPSLPRPAPSPSPEPATAPTPASTATLTSVPAPALPDTDSPAVTEPSLPSLAQLPAAERAQLPALKLSMHVYADDPAQRFVILDGRRLGEGASPAAGVVLEQIRRDGLVLSVNGQRLLLARP